MAKKVKVKKGVSNPFEFWGMLRTSERLIVCIPVVLLIGVLGWVFFGRHNNGAIGRAALEQKMTTKGQWDSFGDYGVDVWMPTEFAVEKLSDDIASYSKLCATRDKGGFPEITVGSFVVPDDNIKVLDVAVNTTEVLDVIRPYMYDAFAQMFNGVSPSLNGDINIIDVEGNDVLEFKGSAQLTVVYKDPTGKTADGEPYSEETETNIYYMVKVFGGRPVVVWGTWDYSTYQGEEKVMAAVRDGIVSVTQTEGATLRPVNGNDDVQKDDGLTDEDRSSGLVGVPYEGIGGTQTDTPIDANGNPIDVPGWVSIPNSDDVNLGGEVDNTQSVPPEGEVAP